MTHQIRYNIYKRSKTGMFMVDTTLSFHCNCENDEQAIERAREIFPNVDIFQLDIFRGDEVIFKYYNFKPSKREIKVKSLEEKLKS